MSDYRNVDAIIDRLHTLKQQYEDHCEDERWWESECGASLVDGIDCHVATESTPCLNEVRGVDYMKEGWNDNCNECKAYWLMDEEVN